jgi:hypothetical protein
LNAYLYSVRGGRAESIHSSHGQKASLPASDQLAQDKSVRALFNNYHNNRPLVLLMDDKYALFPYDISKNDMTYAVLGVYTIAHAWGKSLCFILFLHPINRINQPNTNLQATIQVEL